MNIANIAIFIDGDNISAQHYEAIVNDLKQEGRILLQRVYADFSKPSTNWQQIIMDNGMEAIQTYRIAKKESTDNALIVDCMDTLYNVTTIQKYVIVSSDSDFSSLATKIRLRGLFCIGIGYQHTPLKLRNNCDKFILIEPLVERSVPPSEIPAAASVQSIYDVTHGMEAFLDSVYNKRSVNVITVADLMSITKKYQLKDIVKLPYIKLFQDKLYYFLEGTKNILELSLQLIAKADRVIHMSYLKDFLLNIDSSFDQRRYGFFKMADFAEMVIYQTDSTLSKDEKHNVIIISK